ncbi:UDP-N-acetylmuramoyl-tripeptide--D-alanyl-D-alanine ligase [Kangiella sediminilitoris]|uniref:UDP-N-acetylmuramoyl-tripeptide--D-alanyl-D-alanine ligase n=1 Tax=Kangiella sediminilitoris TaxID=1144748 RepID=A0A1B3BCD3_9GAMM|nr:UDP-N-acetylmuramoyl-tripeptide--D-alanyl-D-alanine ligase [Kangiella sediminilitoris]AOE50469.1 UDP-N-acetylmuramoyl-tripeptide--D-alanyl-D-alanine ligase [Kangiella sediminilitoris]
MIPLTLSAIADFCAGQLIGNDLTVERVMTDSREDCTGSLFVALVGDRFDAHEFINTAKNQGASALMVSRQVESELPQILVKDTQKALGQLARFVRQEVNPKVIGITGSAGKTTVKELVASILRLKGNVLATQGNFNNHIGVPLTLLQLTQDHDYAVIEMGANHKGEIAYCASIAKPDVSVINNVEPAHIEGFGSIEGVAEAKSEIYQALGQDGTAIINLDCDFASQWQEEFIDCHKVTVSRHNDAHFSANNVHLNSEGSVTFDLTKRSIGSKDTVTVSLQLAGEHNVSNALVAAAICSQFDVDLELIKQGLETAGEVKGRLNHLRGLEGCLLIDDTYNASVGAVKAAIDVLTGHQGEHIFVFGDMKELGKDSAQYHKDIGLYAKDKGVEKLYVVGEDVKHTIKAFGENGKWFADKVALIDAIKEQITSQQIILIKGSRSARMEQVVQALIEPQLTDKRGG